MTVNDLRLLPAERNGRVALGGPADRGLASAFVGRASLAVDAARTLASETSVRQNGDAARLKGEYTQQLSKHWQARASFTMIRGRQDGFLGQYRRSPHAILALRYGS